MAGVGAWFLIDPPLYFVNVNGRQELVKKNATIADIIAEGKASPKPGDLIAIDGSVAKEGGGIPFAASVNGAETSDPATVLTNGAVLQISDGANVDETFTEGEEDAPYELDEFDESWDAYYNGSLHLFTHGEDGRQRFKKGDTSGIKQTEIIEEPINGSYIITNASTYGRPIIALTFDDGPWGDTTSQILDVLKENGARATFFTVGSQIEDQADVVARAHAMGCQIATHSWDHAAGSGGGTNICAMSPEEQVAEVEDGFAAIADVIGEEPSRVFRAPGGNFFGDAVRNLEPHLDAEIGWNVDTHDWEQPGVDAIYQSLMLTAPGQVVLMHDGGGDRSQTVEALKKALPELRKKGYQFVTIDELLTFV